MKLLDRVFAYFGFYRKPKIEVKEPKKLELEDFDFIQKAVALNKRMLDEERRRIDIWTDEMLYNDLVTVVKKHFSGQNDALKDKVKLLDMELKTEKSKTKRLEGEIQILENSEVVMA